MSTIKPVAVERYGALNSSHPSFSLVYLPNLNLSNHQSKGWGLTVMLTNPSVAGPVSSLIIVPPHRRWPRHSGTEEVDMLEEAWRTRRGLIGEENKW